MKLKIKESVFSITQLFVLSSVATFLFACSSGNKETLDASTIEPMPLEEQKLIPASSDSLRLTLQNGVFLNHAPGRNWDYNCNSCETIALSESADSAESQFSTTTTQEAGVAESDRVKYDGSTMYVAVNSQASFYGENNSSIKPAHVRVLQRQSNNALDEIANIEVPESTWQFSNLYLNEDTLVMMYSMAEYESNDNVYADVALSDWYYPSTHYIGLKFNDVAAPTSPINLATLKLDGSLVSSRRIGNKLHLVSRYVPELPDDIVIPEDISAAELQALYNRIVQTLLSELLPKVHTENGDELPLVNQSQCFLPANNQSIYGYAEITTVTTFDITNPNQYESKCIVAPLQGLYSSTDNLYLFGSIYEDNGSKTVIHKFTYTDSNIDYVASGSVLGNTGWNNPHLRFSEYDDSLRVLTSERIWSQSDRDYDHRLYVLESNNGGELEAISQLPNDERPDLIGKPNEDVYAVRYFGDKAYVVTFQRTDPLYVLNLSQKSDPYIQGELEIPGYSAYLQPLNENFILGIGQQIDPNNGNNLIPANGESEEFIEGTKAELYDVSDPSAPKVAATIVFENSYSAAEHDYHALTQLKLSEEQFRFAFPTGQWLIKQNEDGSEQWKYQQSMQLINVNISENGAMEKVGSLETESDYYGHWGDRAILHDDIVYYLRGDLVWQSIWSTPELLNGPY
jgi:uncharacterized secreted protein with C-terminal beta-propeller domain